jgi:hypothetical protein
MPVFSPQSLLVTILRHHHNRERWYGDAAAPNAGVHEADPVGPSLAPFALDAGNNAFGAWVPIKGSSDVFGKVGSVYFDMHRIGVVAAERTQPYFIQFAFGPDPNAAVAADDFTTVEYTPVTGAIDSAPVEVLCEPLPIATVVNARCICPNQDTATISFFVGAHGYPD